MLNTVMLVGRLTSDPKDDYITIAIPITFKNAEGEYETDFVDCVIDNSMIKNVQEHCHKGDVVGVRGRLQTENKTAKVIVDKLTFLTGYKK